MAARRGGGGLMGAIESEAELLAEGAIAPPRRRRATPLLLLEAMRPKQWIKTALVSAGLACGGKAPARGEGAIAAPPFVVFCLVGGPPSPRNEVRAAGADRHNPRTASRP